MKFRNTENPYAKEMKKALLEGFRTEEEFSYMNGYEPWDQLFMNKSPIRREQSIYR